MIRIFANANYDFIGLRRYAYGVTGVILTLGVIFLATFGLNYSIEFTGGTLIQIANSKPLDVASVRAALDHGGIRGSEIQSFGSDTEYTIRARVAVAGSDANNTQATADAVKTALRGVLGEGGSTCTAAGRTGQNWCVVRTEAVGPKVGGELRQQAFLLIMLSFVAVLAYLAYRFEWRFGVAAVLATLHDILTTIAFISFMKIEVSLVVVAAVLSMVGYSMNDTIIIFDRVRENLHKYKRDHFADILNRSINETLPRSVLTHGTSLATLLALAIFGGVVIRPFAVVMFFGVFTGTFSSIYIASPVLMAIEKRWPGADARGTKNVRPAKGASSGPKMQPVG
jgi:preprotein translocase subunit SecF